MWFAHVFSLGNAQVLYYVFSKYKTNPSVALEIKAGHPLYHPCFFKKKEYGPYLAIRTKAKKM